MSTVAIITARGGSKGLPRKNVLELAGKPLIAHTIDAAFQSKIFDKVVVTTDDQEIKEVSLKYGAEVIDRPSDLATDTASSLDVIEHTLLQLKEKGEEYSHFILLQPTSPLRNATHIQEAWTKYIQEDAASLVSVTGVEHPPQKMLVNIDGIVKPFTRWEDLTKNRQSLPESYQLNGAIYICNVRDFLKKHNLFIPNLEIYLMSRYESIDIDTKDDLSLTQKILRTINE